MRSGTFTFEAALTEGNHQFRVVFYKATLNSSVIVSNVEIIGSHSNRKSHIACKDCPMVSINI